MVNERSRKKDGRGLWESLARPAGGLAMYEVALLATAALAALMLSEGIAGRTGEAPWTCADGEAEVGEGEAPLAPRPPGSQHGGHGWAQRVRCWNHH